MIKFRQRTLVLFQAKVVIIVLTLNMNLYQVYKNTLEKRRTDRISKLKVICPAKASDSAEVFGNM